MRLVLTYGHTEGAPTKIIILKVVTEKTGRVKIRNWDIGHQCKISKIQQAICKKQK